jgi:hypothetical protein
MNLCLRILPRVGTLRYDKLKAFSAHDGWHARGARFQMVQLDTAAFSLLGLVLALGMMFFSLRLRHMFAGSKIATAWETFAVSCVILAVISSVSTLQAFESLTLPVWWREGSALVFRLALFYAFYKVYLAWVRVGKS